MKFLLFLITMCLSLCQVYAQAILKIDNIDHIDLGKMEFLRTEAENRFGTNTISLDQIEYESELLWEGFYYSTNRDDIYPPSSNEGSLINTNDLLDMCQQEFGRVFLPTKTGNRQVLEKTDGQYKYVLSVLNEYLLIVEEYRKSYYRLNGTLAGEEWILQKAYKHPYYLIEVNEKTMMGLLKLKASGFWNGGYIAGTKDRMFIQVGDFDFSAAKAIERNNGEHLKFLAFDNDHFEQDFYFLEKQTGGTYKLKDHLGNILLEGNYDTIRYSNHFIVAERNGAIEIHFQDFKTEPLKNVRAAYPYYSNRRPYLLEVLQDNMVKVVDISGKILPKDKIPQAEALFLCGTVPGWRYEIQGNTAIYYDMGYGGGTPEDSLKISLAELKADELKFINGTTKVYGNTNDRFIGSNVVDPSVILFRKKGKYGLVNINFDNAQTPYIITLPAVFDEIIFESGQPLKLKKGNLYGWYPFDQKVKYKQLEKFGHHFSRFQLPDGKKGWMDTKGKVYLDQ